MTTQNLREWLEIVGLFSVVASLIFVGLQMKQTHEIALANQYQERANNQLELIRTEMEIGRSIMSLMDGSPTSIRAEPTPEEPSWRGLSGASPVVVVQRGESGCVWAGAFSFMLYSASRTPGEEADKEGDRPQSDGGA